MFKHTLCVVLAALASGQALACYTVYDRQNQVVYRAQTPPVDMSQPLHETVPAAFPGGHMVFGLGTDCPLEQPTALRLPVRPTAGASPLLTDTRTAAAMGMPHTILPTGVALVRERPDSMSPGIVVADADPPPEVSTAVMGAGPAPSQRRSPTVITEMHNPPLTAVQPAPRYRSPAVRR